MVTRRTPRKRTAFRCITEESITLFRSLVDLENAGLVRSAEHNVLAVQLHRALRRKVWEPNVCHVTCGADYPPWPPSLDFEITAVEQPDPVKRAALVADRDAKRAEWTATRELRAALVEASGLYKDEQEP